MPKIGPQPITSEGKDAIATVIAGLSKTSNRAIDPTSLKISVKHADGKTTELQSSDSLELSAIVAAAKPSAKPAKPAKPAKSGSANQTAPKGPPPKSPFDESSS